MSLLHNRITTPILISPKGNTPIHKTPPFLPTRRRTDQDMPKWKDSGARAKRVKRCLWSEETHGKGLAYLLPRPSVSMSKCQKRQKSIPKMRTCPVPNLQTYKRAFDHFTNWSGRVSAHVFCCWQASHLWLSFVVLQAIQGFVWQEELSKENVGSETIHLWWWYRPNAI